MGSKARVGVGGLRFGLLDLGVVGLGLRCDLSSVPVCKDA